MHSYIMTFKPNTTDEEIQKVRDDIKAKGGNIKLEYTLIKGFAFEVPEQVHATVFESHPQVESVEVDGVVTTQ